MLTHLLQMVKKVQKAMKSTNTAIKESVSDSCTNSDTDVLHCRVHTFTLQCHYYFYEPLFNNELQGLNCIIGRQV